MTERIIAERINSFAKEYDYHGYCDAVEDEEESIELNTELLLDRDYEKIIDWIEECVEDLDEYYDSLIKEGWDIIYSINELGRQ